MIIINLQTKTLNLLDLCINISIFSCIDVVGVNIFQNKLYFTYFTKVSKLLTYVTHKNPLTISKVQVILLQPLQLSKESSDF